MYSKYESTARSQLAVSSSLALRLKAGEQLAINMYMLFIFSTQKTEVKTDRLLFYRARRPLLQ